MIESHNLVQGLYNSSSNSVSSFRHDVYTEGNRPNKFTSKYIMILKVFLCSLTSEMFAG
jgi:hypothetical protein